MKHTTQEHFELFKREVKKWIKEFNIGDWEICFKYGCKRKNVFASFVSDLEGRTCTFFFTKDWDDTITPLTNEAINNNALHEVLHLILTRLDTLARARYLAETEINEEEEAIVNRLLNFILKR